MKWFGLVGLAAVAVLVAVTHRDIGIVLTIGQVSGARMPRSVGPSRRCMPTIAVAAKRSAADRRRGVSRDEAASEAQVWR